MFLSANRVAVTLLSERFAGSAEPARRAGIGSETMHKVTPRRRPPAAKCVFEIETEHLIMVELLPRHAFLHFFFNEPAHKV